MALHIFHMLHAPYLCEVDEQADEDYYLSLVEQAEWLEVYAAQADRGDQVKRRAGLAQPERADHVPQCKHKHFADERRKDYRSFMGDQLLQLGPPVNSGSVASSSAGG